MFTVTVTEPSASSALSSIVATVWLTLPLVGTVTVFVPVVPGAA